MTRFDWMARCYERISPCRTAPTIAQDLGLRPEHTVLDVGGGTGQVGGALAGQHARWIVVDPSGGMLRRTRDKPATVRPVRGVGERLPLKDASVDRVVMVDALHHARDADAVMCELRRVLRHDGRGVIQEFRMDRWYVRWPTLLSERLSFFGSRFDRPEGWRRRLEAAGFRVRVVPVTRRDVHLAFEPAPARPDSRKL